MHPAIPRLIDLQAIDHHIAALRAEIEAFPKLIHGRRPKLTNARAAVAAAKEAQLNSPKRTKEIRARCRSVERTRAQISRPDRLGKTNEAYKALQHEIANAEAEISKAEDRQLELMMGSEEIDSRMRQADAT